MEESKIFQIQSSLTKVSTMNSWLRMQFDTLENLSPDAYKRLFELNNKSGWLSFNVNMIEPEDIIDLPPVKKKDAQKYTPSQRLRHAIYRLWQQDCKDKSEEDFYEWYIEFMINKIKERLE